MDCSHLARRGGAPPFVASVRSLFEGVVITMSIGVIGVGTECAARRERGRHSDALRVMEWNGMEN